MEVVIVVNSIHLDQLIIMGFHLKLLAYLPSYLDSTIKFRNSIVPDFPFISLD